MRGVVGVNRDCVGSGGGSSFNSTERSVARRVRGLGATTDDSEMDDEEVANELEGSSRRRGLVCVTGELRTASRTGSKAGIASKADSKSKAEY